MALIPHQIPIMIYKIIQVGFLILLFQLNIIMLSTVFQFISPFKVFFATTKKFYIKPKKINDLNYFMEVINTPHELSETNKLLKSLKTGGVGINRHNFQTIFKKYIYYLKIVHSSENYERAKLSEKIIFLDHMTEIYESFGRISGVHLIKIFNKVSKQLMESDKVCLKTKIQIMRAVSRYNVKRALSLYFKNENHITSSSFLKNMGFNTAFTLLNFFSHVKFYNRLLVQRCIDTFYEEIDVLPFPILSTILFDLGNTHYPINKTFVLKMVKRLENFFFSQDISSIWSIRERIKLLDSLSLIERNMKLSSAYLPALDPIYSINLNLFMEKLDQMKDSDLMNLSNFFRRICFYNENYLQTVALDVMRRQVKQLIDLSSEEEKKEEQNLISLNSLCSILHLFAVYNYRNKKFIDFSLGLLKIAFEMRECRQNLSQKFYSRVVWALCVLCSKKQLSSMYKIFQTYFEIRKKHKIEDLINFYYMYLLIKIYFPKINFSFEAIRQIQDNPAEAMVSLISKTHLEVYNCFLQNGIPCLKQYSITNLMCDIFVPRYKTDQNGKEIYNLVIDVHGFYHFMRNCSKLNGGSVLKKKILEEEGYIYQYIGVDEWGMIEDKDNFITIYMKTLIEKYGKEIKKDEKLLDKKND